MNEKPNWSELLTIAGFQYTVDEETKFNISIKDFNNWEFLNSLIDLLHINVATRYGYIEFLSTTPTLDEWVANLYAIGERGVENGRYKMIRLENIDIPMLGIVTQINRLGLHTEGSCSGHKEGKSDFQKWAYLDFVDPYTAVVAKKLISSLGFTAKLTRDKSVQIFEQHPNLFELGLQLSKVENVSELKKGIFQERTDLLEELLQISGASTREELVQNFLLQKLPKLLGKVWMDNAGNIPGEVHHGNGPTILLSAHMDVYSDIPTGSEIIKTDQIWKRNTGILGADDRAGIALIMNILGLLQESEFQGTIKVAFTVQEEIGQIGAEHIDRSFLENADYAISLDRRNSCDIVTKSYRYAYCHEEYGKIFEKASQYLT